jgi:hypothetical protein
MKQCPTCARTYADDTTTFCLDDGSLLSAPYDSNATLQIPGRDTSPPPTLVMPGYPPSTQSTPYYSQPAQPIGQKSRAKLYTVISLLVLVVGVGIFAAVKLSQNSQPSTPSTLSSDATPKPTETRPPTDYLRTPWLALEVWQDGKAAGLLKVDLRRTRVSLKREPFEIRVPRLKDDAPVLVVAWTSDSIFSKTNQGDKADEESDSYFNPYKAMADTPAGSGTIILDEDANYIYDEERLKPISDSQSTIFISSVSTGGEDEHSLKDQKDDLYLVIFRDFNHNKTIDNGEYEFLVLDF